MPDTFPTALFAFDEQEIAIDRRTVSGGVALSGEEDLIETDGGGRVTAEFANGPLNDRDAQLAWRAFDARYGSGTEPIIVPFCDPLHQPYSTGEESDLVYEDAPANASVHSAPLRATELTVALVLPMDLKGGEWFSVEHPTKGWRAYNIKAIASQTGTQAKFSFVPPAREAIPAGAHIEFLDPRCLMRVDGRPSRRIEIGRYGEAAVRFVEAP